MSQAQRPPNCHWNVGEPACRAVEAEQLALRTSEERYRTLFNSSRDAIMTLESPSWRFTSGNAACVAMFGAKDEADFMAHPPWEWSPEFQVGGQPSADKAREMIETATREGSHSFEWRHKRADGREFPASVLLTRFQLGGRTLLQATVRDISGQKRAEQQLRESEQRLHFALQQSRTGGWDFDLVDNTVYRTLEHDRIFGYESLLPEWTYGMFLDHVLPEDRAEVDRSFRVSTATQTDWSFECRIRRKDGAVRWIWVAGGQQADAEGRARRTAGIVQDITARKLAEMALQENERRLRMALDAARMISWEQDFETNHLTYSSDFAAFFGLSGVSESIELEDAMAGVHPDDRQRVRKALSRALKSGEDYVCEFRGPDWQGARQWFFAHGQVSRDVHGAPERFSGVTMNISGRKRLEAELVAARDAALDAARLKSEFLANVSHEIRTPMNAIIGMTDMVLDTKLTAEQRDYLDTVKSSSRGLLTLLNDILDLSKIEAGKLHFERVAFSLRESLDETLRTHALAAHQKGLELVCDIGPDIPDALLGDPWRLRQIITNLIGNAIKFTDHGEVVLRVRTDVVSDNAADLHVTMTDTGIGIAPKDQAAIFQPFVQADGSMTRRYSGTGLGLAICSQLVEMMGGRIWVESEVGSGSVFHLTVPVTRQPAGDRTPGSGEVWPLLDVTVLVVDDNATSRRTLVEMLKSWGMVPADVADAAAALAALDRAQAAGAPFALALVDIEMPGIDGLALARRIAENARHAAVPLLLMDSVQPRLTEAKSTPAVAGVLHKPIRAARLFEAIQAVRGGQAVRHDDARASAPRPANGTGQRVLLAEDNAVNQRLVIHMLEKRGYRVVAVADGRQALAALEHERFDVILMDVQMPVMDGFEAAAAIRAREQASGGHVPIVALTAHALAGDRARCLAAGMDAYVAKPIEAAEFLATLARLVAGGAVEASGPLPMQATSTPVLDRTSLLRRAGGDLALVLEMVAVFREETTQLLAEIRCGLSRRDPPALARAAHTLKGALATLAARAASDAAFRLETLGRTGDLSSADEAWTALERELNRLEPELSALTSCDSAAETG